MNVLQYLIVACCKAHGLSLADLCKPFVAELRDAALALILGASVTLALLAASAVLNCFDTHKADSRSDNTGTQFPRIVSKLSCLLSLPRSK